jgi:tripartite-type tricarboxylate transporter receptor subunit TctC
MLASVLLCAAGMTSAQNFPNRPIRMIIPQPAGGTMDSNARALSA